MEANSLVPQNNCCVRNPIQHLEVNAVSGGIGAVLGYDQDQAVSSSEFITP